LTIPAGTRLVGEAWSVLAGKGPAFQDQQHPRPVIRVGEKGGHIPGPTEITDVVFTTVGPAAGAIVVEWNVRQPNGMQAGAGMWDSHIRQVVVIQLGVINQTQQHSINRLGGSMCYSVDYASQSHCL